MINFLRFTFLILIGLFSCNEEDIRLYLNSIDPNTYYSEEVIPENYRKIYGKWSLQRVSGGFTGTGHEPNHDFLEIKSIGIYGIIRNDSLLEYGKIKPDTFDTRTKEFLQIRMIPESSEESFFYPREKYIHLNGSDELILKSPCCDMYDYHYKRSN